MRFSDLPTGASIFLDANPLVYHFASDPLFGPASIQLIRRIEKREVAGFTVSNDPDFDRVPGLIRYGPV